MPSVSARAIAEATLCAPSITSHGFWPSTSTRAGHWRRGETIHDVFASDREIRLDFRQQIEACQNDRDIVGLMRTEQRQLQSPPVAAPGSHRDVTGGRAARGDAPAGCLRTKSPTGFRAARIGAVRRPGEWQCVPRRRTLRLRQGARA